MQSVLLIGLDICWRDAQILMTVIRRNVQHKSRHINKTRKQSASLACLINFDDSTDNQRSMQAYRQLFQCYAIFANLVNFDEIILDNEKKYLFWINYLARKLYRRRSVRKPRGSMVSHADQPKLFRRSSRKCHNNVGWSSEISYQKNVFLNFVRLWFMSSTVFQRPFKRYCFLVKQPTFDNFN